MASITIPLGGYRDDYSYYGVSSSYPLSNTIGSTASGGSKYSGINLTRNANATTYIYMTFDVSSIPENATITSVTGNVRVHGSTTSQNRTSSRTLQFYSGSNTKGDSVNFSMTGSATIYSIEDSGTWTRDELNDLAIKLQCVRNSSNTTSNTYVYWLGADITIEYEEKPLTKYDVSIQVGSGATVDKDAANEVFEGDDFTIQITSDNITSITDNEQDVLDKLVRGTINSDSDSVTNYPSSVTTSGSIRGTNYRNAVGNSSSNTESGNDYCSSSGSTANVIYSFDFSSIPENAVVQSVSVTVGGHLESTSSSSEVANLQLYSGDNKKGEQSKFTTTSKQVVTMDAGTWTRDELLDAKLYFTIGYYGGLVNGVDFVVTYTIPTESSNVYIYTINGVYENHTILINLAKIFTPLRIKVNGQYKKVLKIFQKENGQFVEKTVNDIPRNNLYKK